MVALAFALAAPASASAAQSLSVTSATGFPAGGDPTYTTTVGLDTSAGTPSAMIVTLAPGVLASAAADPACVTGTPQDTAACQIGSGSVSTVAPVVTIPFTAYLTPPTSAADVAGIDLVTGVPTVPTTHAEVSLVQTATGNISTVLHVDLTTLGTFAQFVSGMSFTVDGTLNGKPFNRMPTNCSPGPSSLTVVYANGSETTRASPDFAPSGCAGLPYAPALTATATKDSGDTGTEVVTRVTQSAGEAASSSTTLVLPVSVLGTNLPVLALQNTTTAVGSATASTPLLTAPLNGQVFLTGAPLTPVLTVRFPPPAALTLTGVVNLSQGSVTIANIPDVPLTSLVFTLFGGPRALLSSTCAPRTGTAQASFTSQGGKTVTTSQLLTLGGCPPAAGAAPGPPTISGATLRGLAKGKPVLRFTLSAGKNAPALKSFTLALPGGLRFQSKGLSRGVSIGAGRTLRLGRGRLTVTLAGGASRVVVKIAGRALQESKQLKRRARRHAAGPLLLGASVADAGGRVTRLVVLV